MLLDFFYMLEVCCGSGARSRTVIAHMQRLGWEGRSLLIDFVTLGQLLLTYRKLKPHVEDGSISYFEAYVSHTDATGRSAATG